MISRYSRPEMAQWFDDETVLRLWIQIEAAIAAVQVKDGIIPRTAGRKLLKSFDEILKKKTYSLKKMREIEKVTRHETLAFVEMISELLGPESAYVHLGATSSDILDTTLMLQLKNGIEQLLPTMQKIAKILLRRAKVDRDLVTIGRTHGMFAEPTSFGLKWLSWHSEALRNQQRLEQALEEVSFSKISGAVGNNPFITVDQEVAILKRLGLRREPVATQVVPRDRVAHALQTFALVGVWIERVCVEIRHLQRSEVGEVQEAFASRQKGSSAMPHKKNPIGCENLVGCARLLRSNAQAALENCALWHERDMSHSSVERIIVPDSLILLDYMLDRFQGIVDGLIVNREGVKRNRNLAGDVALSGKLLTQLSKNGCPRTVAYELVQKVAFQAREKGLSLEKSFEQILKQDPDLHGRLGKISIRWNELTSDQHHLKQVRKIFTSWNAKK